MTDRKQATNITEMRDQLLRIFNDLNAGTMEARDAVEINNTAGKIISSVKVQLAYHVMRKESPDIEFLNSPPTTKTIEHKPDDSRVLPLKSEQK